MNKRSKYLISAILVIIALLLLVGTFSPFLLMMFNSASHAINGGEVPMRVVGANYPIFTLYILVFSFIVCMLLLFLYAKRRKTTSVLFWINGIAISLIISHAAAWMELLLVIRLVD